MCKLQSGFAYIAKGFSVCILGLFIAACSRKSDKELTNPKNPDGIYDPMMNGGSANAQAENVFTPM